MENREMYEFIVLRRPPPFPERFHFSLTAFELSRKAMLAERERGKLARSYINTRNQEIPGQGPQTKPTELRKGPETKPAEVGKGPETKPTEVGKGPGTKPAEITKSDHEGFQNDAIKRLCVDIIIVATHELDIEEREFIRRETKPNESKQNGEMDIKERKLERIETKPNESRQNGERDFLSDRGDGYLPDREDGFREKDPMSVECRKHGVPEEIKQNKKCYTDTESEERLQEIAKQICHEAITKARYRVAKENLDHLQSTGDFQEQSTPTCSNENESNEGQLPVEDQLKALEKTDNKSVTKKSEKIKLNEEKKLQKFQEQKVKEYLKMVNKKYKERNENINKILKKQAKEDKQREKKLKRDSLKAEKKEKKLKEKETKLEKKRQNNMSDKQTTITGQDSNENRTDGQTGNGKSFGDRIREIFGCFFH